METEDDKDFYHSLSKKKLQELCRRYGLSPYMTKPNLVNSLYSYFKKKNLCSVSLVESLSLHSTSLIPPVESGAQSDSVVRAPKCSYGNTKCLGEKNNRKTRSQFVKCSEGGNFTGAESYNKVQDLEYPWYDVQDNYRITCKKRETYCLENELGCNENGFGYRGKSSKISLDNNNLSFAREAGVSDAPHIRSRNLNDGACLVENASTSSIKSSKPVPSFEFYVSSEEGINLIVDMNSSPSEWSKKWESKVCSCHNKFDNKFGSLREELHLLGNSNKQIKNLFPCNIDSEKKVNNGDIQVQTSSSSIKRDGDSLAVDHPYGDDGFSRSSPKNPCNDAVEMSTQLEEDKELPHFSSPNYDIRNHMISVAGYGSIDRETVTHESSAINIPQMKSSSNSVVNSTQEGPKGPDLLEDHNSEVGDKSCEDQPLQNTSTHVSPSRVCPGFSATCSIEMQLSEVVSPRKDASCSPCRNDGPLDAVDAMLNMETRDDGLANSSTCQDHISACAEEMEGGKLTYGGETSGSLQLTKSLEKTLDESEADELRKRKRQHSEGKDLNGCGEHNTRSLRSRTRLLERTFPRRSMRLVSKCSLF